MGELAAADASDLGFCSLGLAISVSLVLAVLDVSDSGFMLL